VEIFLKLNASNPGNTFEASSFCISGLKNTFALDEWAVLSLNYFSSCLFEKVLKMDNFLIFYKGDFVAGNVDSDNLALLWRLFYSTGESFV
jgi:hypothetical protein